MIAVLAAVPALPARAQSDTNLTISAPPEAPGALVAVMAVALYNAQANLQERTDARKALLADSVLHATLARLLPGQLADSDSVRPPHGPIRSTTSPATSPAT